MIVGSERTDSHRVGNARFPKKHIGHNAFCQDLKAYPGYHVIEKIFTYNGGEKLCLMKAPNGDEAHGGQCTGKALRDAKWNIENFEGLDEEITGELDGSMADSNYLMNWNDVVGNFETLYLTKAIHGKAQ